MSRLPSSAVDCAAAAPRRRRTTSHDGKKNTVANQPGGSFPPWPHVAESDSDSEIDYYSNRGHKLKKKGRFAHKGQLVPATGPSAYKEVSPAQIAGDDATQEADANRV